MPENIKSKLRLFADDTIAYIALKPKSNAAVLQNDIDYLGDWEEKWKMEFHPDKCQMITITRNKHIVRNKDTLRGHTLETVDQAKYLGVNLSSKLNWNTHINNITSKANKSLGFLRRNLKISSQSIKTQAYFSLVRPLVEYSNTVWDPYTQMNINKIEMVQRRAARYVTNSYNHTASVTDMLQRLCWRSLKDRRVDARLCMLYKIHHGIVAIPSASYLTPLARATRHHHEQAFKIPKSRCDYHKFSFFPRTIQMWNTLPAAVINSKDIDTFKIRVQSLNYENIM